MAYAVLNDLKNRLKGAYPALTDRTGGVTADDVIGQEILDGAHGTLHTYLAQRYGTPVDVSGDSTLAQAVKEHVLNIAEFKAWSQNSPREEIPRRVTDSFNETMRTLRDIAAGKAALPGVLEIPGPTSSGPSAGAVGEARIMTGDALKGF